MSVSQEERDLMNENAAFKARIALLEADADRYIWLMAHMGRMDSVAKTWVPGKHKPLLIYLQDYIDSEIPKAGAGWVGRQRALLQGDKP